MNVQLIPHTARNVATGKKESFSLYRVCMDDVFIGMIGWKPESKLLLTVRLGPIEEQQVQEHVAKLLKRKIQSSTVPDVPEELMHPENEDEELGVDDFDES